MYQAMQNILHGFGAIMGASLGGVIADAIGWRFCFLLQVPISLAVLLIAGSVVGSRQEPESDEHDTLEQPLNRQSTWQKIDFSGACLLFGGLSLLLVALSMGSNEKSWDNPYVLACLGSSVLMLVIFFIVEGRTKAIPLMPLEMLKSIEQASLLLANICFGLGAYGVRHGYFSHISIPELSWLTLADALPHAPILPSCSLGLCLCCWITIGSTITRHTYRWTNNWPHHEARWSIRLGYSLRVGTASYWHMLDPYTQDARTSLEVLCLLDVWKLGPRHDISCYPLHIHLGL